MASRHVGQSVSRKTNKYGSIWRRGEPNSGAFCPASIIRLHMIAGYRERRACVLRLKVDPRLQLNVARPVSRARYPAEQRIRNISHWVAPASPVEGVCEVATNFHIFVLAKGEPLQDAERLADS